ncbi:hypothetical protein HPB51_019089 [Rhipicephalus microplus]|uniref:Transposable element P transposase n=1 Tax=Rhipicephalus microplus TaxID=6941 RepID=A0A9J6EJ32_RHIMP|nr:hypothetical protein HPB51_019089 [Rhipicephalus microplus]
MSGTRRAGLSKDAVPSIFEGAPSYLSRKIKSPRKQVKRLALPVAASVSSCNNNSSNLPTTASHIEVSPADNMETSSDDSCCVTKTGESNSCDSVFERLFSAVSCVSLPQPSWAAHLINLAGVRDVVFIDAAVAHRTSDGSSVLFNRKALHVKSNMEVQVYILDKLIDSAAIGVSPFATSALEVESMLKVVDGIDVCRGGPSLKDFPDVSPECAFVDCQKSWRHNKCLLVTPGGAICRLCSGLVDTLRIHADRRAARAKQGIPLKRFRLSVVPTQQQKLSALRHARSAVQRSRARLAKRNKLLLEQLQAAMKELTDLQEQDIKEKLKGFDIPPAQLLLIEECVSVARCASKTSRRYTDDWILLCLLLHIRSPATYSFLRNNDILPLPCVTTVRKYISMVDNENKAELKVCPKITFNHINPSKMLRMRVKLATQIFSNSVAKGILFYAKRGASRLTNVEPTVEFTLFLNDLFDALNRRFPAEGLKLEGRDFCVLESASAWLDSWEQQVVSGEIHKDLFLTQSTAEGLRVTLKSVRELSIYLLKDCDFKYVLTAKMNQDPLERFFGIIRQAGGQNEHPTFPTFLQLYRMLSLYSLVKPPKFGNCTLPDKRQAAVVTLSDIREIYKGSAAQRTGKLDELKRKLDGLIDEGSWECDDVFDFDDPDTDATVVDCIVYYVTGFVSRKLRNGTTCSICKNALQGKQGLASVPEADLVNCKTRGWLTHPNMHLFDFFKYTEEQFAKSLTALRLPSAERFYTANGTQAHGMREAEPKGIRVPRCARARGHQGTLKGISFARHLLALSGSRTLPRRAQRARSLT